MDFAAFLIQLNLLISDTLLQLTVDQKTAALTAAFNDRYVIKRIWDATLVFSMSTYQYALPVGLTTVNEIYLTRSTDNFPERLSAELWEVINGQIQFDAKAKYKIPDGYTLYLRGDYKYVTTDVITSTGLQNYIISLAGYNALRGLAYARAFSFLRNDTTMGEVVALRREMYADMIHYRQQLPREYVAA